MSATKQLKTKIIVKDGIIECPVNKDRRGRYLSEDAHSFAKMVESAERRLLRAIVTNPSHVLHHALPKLMTLA